MSKIPVAVVQLNSSSDWKSNLEQADYWVGQASQAGAKWVVLPENFLCFDASLYHSLAMQDFETGLIKQSLKSLAQKHQVFLCAGTVPCLEKADGSLLDDGRVFSTSWFVDPEGQFIGRYDKMHLFDVQVADAFGQYQESSHICAGDKPLLVDLMIENKFIKVGASVCYDLRFPELYHFLSKEGALIACVPSAFTSVTGQAHWLTLLQARAIENQMFILAANQVGQHGPSRTTYGHSAIVDPWGRVLALLDLPQAGFICAILDLDEQQRIRCSMPVLQHRHVFFQS
jgi:predicted amidohydrolase